MLNEKYLIIGGNSLVGSSIYKYFKNKNAKVKFTTRNKKLNKNAIFFDLNHPKKLNIKNSKVFFCAAQTSIPYCEENPQLSELVNVKNTVTSIKNLLKNNCKIVYFSSQAVFDGNKKNSIETDKLNPTCNYGKQKLLVEKELRKLKNIIIIRPTKILSTNDGLLHNWKKLLIKNKKISVFDDLFISPISVDFVINFVVNIEKQGIYHLSGNSKISYFNLIKKICIKNQINYKLIDKISYKNSDRKILYKPKYCSLSTKYEGKYNIQKLQHFLNDTKFN